MNTVPPTNPAPTKHASLTSVSAKVIEGLGTIKQLPVNKLIPAKIIELKQINLLKLSTGDNEFIVQLSGNIPTTIKKNTPLKFLINPASNNIQLFPKTVESPTTRTPQEPSNRNEATTSAKQGNAPTLQSPGIKIGNWVKAAIISKTKLLAPRELTFSQQSKNENLKRNSLTTHTLPQLQKKLKSAPSSPMQKHWNSKNMPELIGFFIKNDVAKSLFMLKSEHTIDRQKYRKTTNSTTPLLGHKKQRGVPNISKTPALFRFRENQVGPDISLSTYPLKARKSIRQPASVHRATSSYFTPTMRNSTNVIGGKVFFKNTHSVLDASLAAKNKPSSSQGVSSPYSPSSQSEIFLGNFVKIQQKQNLLDPSKISSSQTNERRKAVFSLQEITAIKRTRADLNLSKVSPKTIPQEVTRAILQSNLDQRKTIPVTDVRIVSVADKNSTSISSKINANSTINFGKIVAQTPSGQTILSIEEKFLILNGALKHPIGTNLVLQFPLSPIEQNRAQSSNSNIPFALSAFPNWSNLEELLDKLNYSEKTPTQKEFLENIISKPGKNLTASLAYFLSAVRTGQAKNWTGTLFNEQAFSNRERFLEQLQDDFSFMQKASEPSDTGWRGFFLPLLDENHLSIIQFFLRNEHHRKPNAKTKNDNDAVQFLLEVNLTTIGTMQIEGRIKNKELDLIIRTRKFLKGPLKQGIERVFIKTLTTSELVGKLTFRVHSKLPPLPIDKLNGYIRSSIPSTII